MIKDLFTRVFRNGILIKKIFSEITFIHNNNNTYHQVLKWCDLKENLDTLVYFNYLDQFKQCLKSNPIHIDTGLDSTLDRTFMKIFRHGKDIEYIKLIFQHFRIINNELLDIIFNPGKLDLMCMASRYGRWDIVHYLESFNNPIPFGDTESYNYKEPLRWYYGDAVLCVAISGDIEMFIYICNKVGAKAVQEQLSSFVIQLAKAGNIEIFKYAVETYKIDHTMFHRRAFIKELIQNGHLPLLDYIKRTYDDNINNGQLEVINTCFNAGPNLISIAKNNNRHDIVKWLEIHCIAESKLNIIDNSNTNNSRNIGINLKDEINHLKTESILYCTRVLRRCLIQNNKEIIQFILLNRIDVIKDLDRRTRNIIGFKSVDNLKTLHLNLSDVCYSDQKMLVDFMSSTYRSRGPYYQIIRWFIENRPDTLELVTELELDILIKLNQLELIKYFHSNLNIEITIDMLYTALKRNNEEIISWILELQCIPLGNILEILPKWENDFRIFKRPWEILNKYISSYKLNF